MSKNRVDPGNQNEKIIYNTQRIINLKDYFSYPEISDNQTKNSIIGITNSLVLIFKNLKPRYEPDYSNDLVKIRKNIRNILENPTLALERIKKEENLSNFEAYTRIYERGKVISEDQFRSTIDFCLKKFTEDIEAHKTFQKFRIKPMKAVTEEGENELTSSPQLHR